MIITFSIWLSDGSEKTTIEGHGKSTLAAGLPNPQNSQSSLATKLKSVNQRMVDAIQVHDFNAVDDLIQKGADVNAYAIDPYRPDSEKSEPILMIAVEEAGAVRGLFNRGKDKCGDCVKIVQRLIDARANVNGTLTWNGQSPLHRAVVHNDLLTSQILLDAGANVNARDNDGETPLLFDEVEDEHIARLLLARGADVNARASSRFGTPLNRAARNCSVDLVQLLIEHGANLNTQGIFGMTALMEVSEGFEGFEFPSYSFAEHPNCLATASLLLNSGANPLLKDSSGRRVLMIASERSQVEFFKLLLSFENMYYR